VEYVAVARGPAWVGGGLTGRGAGRAPGAVVGVVGGGSAGVMTPGCRLWDSGAAGAGEPGLTGAAPRSRTGTVEEEVVVGFAVVLVGADLATGGPDSSALTTSWWASTRAGRSVTSAATMDVAVQTMAVDATVAISQSPEANERGSDISTG